MAEACESCTYYDIKHANAGVQTTDNSGLCRFNPPVPQAAPDAQGLWPVVTKEDWCGHYSTEAHTH